MPPSLYKPHPHMTKFALLILLYIHASTAVFKQKKSRRKWRAARRGFILGDLRCAL